MFSFWRVLPLGICLILRVVSQQSSNIESEGSPSLSMHRVPIHGNVSIGYYYIDIFIGTPPQKTSLIVDTGSGVEALPCEPCKACGNKHINPRFSTTRSTTSRIMTCTNHTLKECKGCTSKQGVAQNKPCQFTNGYAEGSTLKGFFVEDIIAVVDDPSQSKSEGVRATFGCVTEQTNQFLTQAADGIIGLAPHRESNLLEKIYQEHAHLTAEKLEFGLCFALNGGEFSIGNINERLHDKDRPPVAVKFRQVTNPIFNNLKSLLGTPPQKFYSLNIQQLFIGGRSLELRDSDLDGDGLFVDSGATYSYLHSYQYNIVLEQLDKVCKSFNCVIAKGDSNRCYHFKDLSKTLAEEVGRFPNLTLTLPGSNSTIDWTPWSYFMVRNETAREVCVGLLSLSRMILGSNWMTNRDIYFDLSDNQMLVYDSPGCKPFPEWNTSSQQLRTLRMMYETMQPQLVEATFEEYSVNWVWIAIVAGILIAVVLAAFLIVCLMNMLEKRQTQTKAAAQQNRLHRADNEQSESVATTLQMHEQAEPPAQPFSP